MSVFLFPVQPPGTTCPPAPSCANCANPPQQFTAYLGNFGRWNATGSPSPCADCPGALVGPYTLTYQSGCTWSGPGNTSCQSTSPITLSIDSAGHWTLTIGASGNQTTCTGTTTSVSCTAPPANWQFVSQDSTSDCDFTELSSCCPNPLSPVVACCCNCGCNTQCDALCQQDGQCPCQYKITIAGTDCGPCGTDSNDASYICQIINGTYYVNADCGCQFSATRNCCTFYGCCDGIDASCCNGATAYDNPTWVEWSLSFANCGTCPANAAPQWCLALDGIARGAFPTGQIGACMGIANFQFRAGPFSEPPCSGTYTLTGTASGSIECNPGSGSTFGCAHPTVTITPLYGTDCTTTTTTSTTSTTTTPPPSTTSTSSTSSTSSTPMPWWCCSDGICNQSSYPGCNGPDNLCNAYVLSGPYTSAAACSSSCSAQPVYWCCLDASAQPAGQCTCANPAGASDLPPCVMTCVAMIAGENCLGPICPGIDSFLCGGPYLNSSACASGACNTSTTTPHPTTTSTSTSSTTPPPTTTTTTTTTPTTSTTTTTTTPPPTTTTTSTSTTTTTPHGMTTTSTSTTSTTPHCASGVCTYECVNGSWVLQGGGTGCPCTCHPPQTSCNAGNNFTSAQGTCS